MRNGLVIFEKLDYVIQNFSTWTGIKQKYFSSRTNFYRNYFSTYSLVLEFQEVAYTHTNIYIHDDFPMQLCLPLRDP